MMAPRPTSNYESYRQAIRVALMQSPGDWSFKSDPGYRTVLEHVTPEQGVAFFEWAETHESSLNWADVFRLARRNDSVGRPLTGSYRDTAGYSPSNWRYLCHAIKVWQHIDSLGLSEVEIVELGGGYGGLALYVDGLRSSFRTRLRHYTIVDLPEAAELQRKVADVLGVPINVLNGLPADSGRLLQPTEGVSQFLVSAYAFSEFDQVTRDWYSERLVSHCDHGLIVWNFPDAQQDSDGRWYGGPVYSFTDKPLTVEIDQPELYAGHLLVRW